MKRSIDDPYLRGDLLYGDDFDQEAIDAWFSAETHAYSALRSEAGRTEPSYDYHALNELHGFRHLGPQPLGHVLGLGSAYGLEFLPVSDRISSLTIVEASDSMRSETIGKVSPTYAKPSPSGILPFSDNSFDLAVCLGVLHHIPNVTTVMREMARVTTPGGRLLVREPIVSMGDWNDRKNTRLTANERGIPIRIFRDIVESSGLKVNREAFCVFPLTGKLGGRLGINSFNSHAIARLDAAVCTLLRRRASIYHPQRRIDHLRPASVYFVLTKEAG